MKQVHVINASLLYIKMYLKIKANYTFYWNSIVQGGSWVLHDSNCYFNKYIICKIYLPISWKHLLQPVLHQMMESQILQTQNKLYSLKNARPQHP